MEFNYLENIRKLKEKIFTPAPFKRLCNEARCPKIKKRWEDHQHKYHSQNDIEPSSEPSKYAPHEIVTETCDQLVQTSTDTKRNAETNCNIFQDNMEALAKITSEVMNSEHVGEFIARNQSCNTTVSFKNVYKERLQYEVLQWLREVPIESEFNSTAKIVTEKIVNNLIDKIDRLSVEADEEWYEVKLKREIDHCLNSLPMSYHSTKCAKIRYILTESLITRIMVLNSKYLYQASNSFQDDLGVMNQYANSKEIFEIPIVSMFENEIFSWLESKNLKAEEGTPLNLKYITKMLLNRLLPFLMNKGTKKSKYLIKGGIVEVLDTLPLTMAVFKNKIFLNGLAMELTNILLNAQNNFEQLTIYNNAYLGFIKTFTLNVNNNMNYPLKHGLAIKHLTLSMSNSKKISTLSNDTGDSSNGKCHSNTSMNDNCKENHFLKLELNMSSFSHLDNTGTEDLTVSHMTLKVLNDVKSRNYIVGCKNSMKTCIPNLLSMSLDSIEKAHTVTENSSCCLDFDERHKKIQTTNIKDSDSNEENAYFKMVSALIRSWIETLPKNYAELMNRNIIESITEDFADELTHQVMFAQLVSENNFEKDSYLGDIILKWLALLGFVKTSDEAISYKNELLLKLQDISLVSQPRMNKLQEAIHTRMQLNKYNIKDFIKENRHAFNKNFMCWINKQPLEICMAPDSSRKLVYDIAVTIYNELNNSSYDSNIKSTLRQWLQNIVESEENICLQSKDVTNKVIQLSRAKNQYELVSKVNRECNQCTFPISNVLENIMKQCLMKFLNEPDLNNRIAKDVFWNILSNILQNFYTQYSNLDTFEVKNQNTTFEKLKTELDYIILISNWFNKLPKKSALNRLSRRQRKRFLVNLAKTIADIDNKGERSQRTDEDFYIEIIMNYCKQFRPLRNVSLDKQMTKPLVDALIEYGVKNVNENQKLPSQENKREENQEATKNDINMYSEKECGPSDDMFKEFSIQVQKQIKNMFDYFFSTFNTILSVSVILYNLSA